MKNLPQRERPGRRSRSSYNRKDKRACVYASWTAAEHTRMQKLVLAFHKAFFGTTKFCPFDPNYAYRYDTETTAPEAV